MNGIRVLVVEDEVSFIEALQVGLEREGFTVEIAKDGSEALIAFEKFNPDLILLDLMPVSYTHLTLPTIYSV